ncbi:MAG: hypothetical protein GX443_10850 [Deltaproteobacteria bacterium]|nr:hypothetical protein [Deltaproteobacteria bacterium]
MEDKFFSWQSRPFDHHETYFRFIDPEEYPRLGIDPQDVPMGTFLAEDHPTFLPSRFGGNAYGLGLIEQSVLSKSDTDFLEKLDLQDASEIGRNARRVNAIYQKLGLLIRFSSTGKCYFLIPINLVAHSLHEIKTKADEIEELIIQHIFETRIDRLDIGLLTAGQDLVVHELTARLSSHRIFLFDSLEKVRSWRMPLDIMILPKDPFEYLLEQKLPRASRKTHNRHRLFNYAVYLAGKIYDILEPNGRVLVLTHAPVPDRDEVCRVRFKSDEELKFFLLFAHTFKTRMKYRAKSIEENLDVHLADLHYYLNRFAFVEPHLKRLIENRKPEELTIEKINELPYLNSRAHQNHVKDPEKLWKGIFAPYFSSITLKRKSPRHHFQYWQERLEIDREIPESLFIFVGKPNTPSVLLGPLEDEVKASGMMGCSLPLVAEYRNTFRFILDVFQILEKIRDHAFSKLSELEQTRLSTPFRTKSQTFLPILGLLANVSKIERCQEILNPGEIEGPVTPVLENIHKLSLHGFTPAQLRELLLIVVGHTTMSRVVFAKVPTQTLKSITDRSKKEGYADLLDLVRVCHLMSVAEVVAALGNSFKEDQARELRRVYDDIVWVATDPAMDWEKLHDIRVSAMGGIQNKCLREMMKFFNLFGFLDNWQEVIKKGPFEREVVCDYQVDRLLELEESLELTKIADRFKRQFMGDYVFGKSYFFRQFLESEFHGTGHLFPRLGVEAGFILLWIAVNAAEKHIINFNPMISGIPPDRLDQRLLKIRETLLSIPMERLEPAFFETIRQEFSQNRPAFVFDTGIRLVNNPQTWALDVSFVDLEENIERMDALLVHFESQKLRAISLRTLQELERRFSELESFRRYLDREGCDLFCGTQDSLRGVALDQVDRRIKQIEERLKFILLQQVLVPEEIYDAIDGLAMHCPEILRFIMPELHAIGNLTERSPFFHKQSPGSYLMRCLEKFQALVIKDRNGFQDPNTFYQLAKQEFGPLAEEGIGASHAQMDILEYILERIQQRPALYQALTLALLFQEIGKTEYFAALIPPKETRWTHAERGAMILERSDLLDKYRLDPQVKQMVAFLVRHHGVVGRVITGKEPMTALEVLTASSDNHLLDVLVLHSILSAAAVREGVMVYDLLEWFLTCRSTALQLLKSDGDWQAWLKESLSEKGAAVLAYFQLTTRENGGFHLNHDKHCGFEEDEAEDEVLWHGRQSAALERLFKLMGILWVDYQDVQMYLLKMPVNFIYHKKKLKSVGLATFEKQLGEAAHVLNILASLNEGVRFYLLYCLDHLGGGMRVYGFYDLAVSLQPEESVKLLLMAFQAFHHFYGTSEKGGLVTFGPLSRTLERRHEILQKILSEMPFPCSCFEGLSPGGGTPQYGGLQFEAGHVEKAVRVDFKDAIQFDEMARSLTTVWNHEELRERYETLVKVLRETLLYDTRNFEKELLRVYEMQQREISDLMLKGFQERLKTLDDLAGLPRIQEEMLNTQREVPFSEEQRFHLKEMFEFHRSRIRDRYLESIVEEIRKIDSREALSDYWHLLKNQLYPYRAYLGKEYESLIAQLIDRRMHEM